MKVVSLLSGGMDSSTLLWYAKHQGFEPIALSVNYNQRHARELKYAQQIAQAAGVEHVVVNLPELAKVTQGSALTSPEVAVPHGHYADENMRITVVPNRNMILLSIAAALAVSRHAQYVLFGAHSGDHAIYPDCRPQFAEALDKALRIATDGYGDVGVFSPFIDINKTDIAKIGHSLGVPFELTWSCYEGGDVHCGKCGTCVERKEAFRDAGVPDPTVYADSNKYDGYNFKTGPVRG